MHHCTLQQVDDSSDSNAAGQQEKQQKRQNQIRGKTEEQNSEVCTFVRTCAHSVWRHISTCIITHCRRRIVILTQTNAQSRRNWRNQSRRRRKRKMTRNVLRCARLYASIRICMHLLASVCICMHLYALNTPRFHITTALEALREPVLFRKCGSSSSRVTGREAGLVIYVSSSRSV